MPSSRGPNRYLTRGTAILGTLTRRSPATCSTAFYRECVLTDLSLPAGGRPTMSAKGQVSQILEDVTDGTHVSLATYTSASCYCYFTFCHLVCFLSYFPLNCLACARRKTD
ncbi:hypothetical protein P389DRAFT_170964 [Cystobasidium minutum MCA 4210]|uniref:uncharacterized protein n=1 Tax=Cystobasidium minutum MCA 4210 TaxID=1397322 RepID=UPI0034CF940E|eukprot:jgi/Rhomi1/170964/fgenesh1_kg.4_\